MRSLTLTPQHLSLNTATLGPGASLHDAVQGCVKYGFWRHCSLARQSGGNRFIPGQSSDS